MKYMRKFLEHDEYSYWQRFIVDVRNILSLILQKEHHGKFVIGDQAEKNKHTGGFDNLIGIIRPNYIWFFLEYNYF